MKAVNCAKYFRDSELREFTNCTLMRTVNQVFEKMKTQISPMPPFDEESDTEDR